MKTLFPVIFTDALSEVRDFYVDLFGFEVLVEISWYVHMRLPADEGMQIAFVASDHHSLPERFWASPAGVAITLEFDDVDVLFDRAKSMGLVIHVELRDESWGQRHFVTEDPAGLMVDVVQPNERGAGEVVAFVPVADGPGAAGLEAEVARLAGGEYAVAMHRGHYVDLDLTYGALGSYVAEHGIAAEGPIVEFYLVGPDTETDPATFRTEVCRPISVQ